MNKLTNLLKIFLLTLLICACSSQPSWMVDEYSLVKVSFEREVLDIRPVEGTMDDILKQYETELSKPAIPPSNELTLGTSTLSAKENYTDNLVTVEVNQNNLPILTIPAGVISPINNFRGLWSHDGHWYLEVAHVEEDPSDPNAAFIIWGEIFKDGKSLNKKFGYEEAFNFTILGGYPFYFIRIDGEYDYVYAGRPHELDYTHIPHYQCCSAGALNPVAYENMITAIASRGEKDFYLVISGAH